MQLTIERAALLKALSHVQSVVERRNTIPILSNVLLTAGSGGLSLTATDMDLSVIETVPAEIGQDGATTVAAHTFYDIVRKLPEGSQLQLDSGGEEGQLALVSGRSRLSLATLPSEEFPVMADDDLPNSFTIPAKELRTLVDRSRFAISTEETRYYLNGIYLHEADAAGTAVLRAVATDGHRLALVETALPQGAAGMPGIIIPRKAITEIRKLAEDLDSDIAIGLSETRIRVAVDGLVLNSKLIDGTFPDYDRVIPSDNTKIMRVDCGAFSNAVDLVSTISTEKSRSIKLSVDAGSLTLSATSPDAGSASEELEVDYSDDLIEIGFNSKYLLDIAQQIDGESAQFVLADSASPTIIQDVGDTSALYVLMPMRV